MVIYFYVCKYFIRLIRIYKILMRVSKDKQHSKLVNSMFILFQCKSCKISNINYENTSFKFAIPRKFVPTHTTLKILQSLSIISTYLKLLHLQQSLGKYLTGLCRTIFCPYQLSKKHSWYL